MLKILSWNIAHRTEMWRTLLDSDVDIALLQEAGKPPSDIETRFDVDTHPWCTEGAEWRPWRTAVVGLNSRVPIHRLTPIPIREASSGELAISRLGTIAVANVDDPDTSENYTLISMYAPWEGVHASTGKRWIYADGSAHRLISDIGVFVGQERGHRILASGDLNILYGYGEDGDSYYAARYQTVFDRFMALGLNFVGPQFSNGRQAEPWPDELPRDSLNVPTFHTNQQTPATATRQLDFVFASRDIANRVRTRALNLVEEWGGSDHCCIRIDVT